MQCAVHSVKLDFLFRSLDFLLTSEADLVVESGVRVTRDISVRIQLNYSLRSPPTLPVPRVPAAHVPRSVRRELES